MLLYRTYELMRMLHATELVQYVTGLDSRITYEEAVDPTEPSWPFESVFPFYRDANGSTEITVLTQASGLPANEPGLIPSNDFDVPDATGRTTRQWRIEQLAGQHRITHLSNPHVTVTETAVFDGGMSNLTDLPESGMKFRAVQAPGAAWDLVAYSRPRRGIGDLETIVASLAGETFTSLFRVGEPQGKQEPWRTFRALWEDHPETAYRLGAVVLALIYHTEEQRSVA